MASRRTEDLEPHLAQAYMLLKEEYETRFPDRQLMLTCTYRSPAEQQALYASGRGRPGPILTNCDGEKKLSKHNLWPAQAFDVAILAGGKPVWDEAAYLELGGIGTALGLKWGGNFKTLKDCPHFEI